MSSLVFLPAALCWWAKKTNNNNSSHDNVYGAVITTEVIARVHPVHLMNADSECRVAANPQTKPVDLGCESAENWRLPSTSTIAVAIITQPVGW